MIRSTLLTIGLTRCDHDLAVDALERSREQTESHDVERLIVCAKSTKQASAKRDDDLMDDDAPMKTRSPTSYGWMLKMNSMLCARRSQSLGHR